MLDKYVFYSDDELKKLMAEDQNKKKEWMDFIADKVEDGILLQDALNDYKMKKYKEMEKNNNLSETKNYFDRI